MPVEVVAATADTVVDAILATGQIEAIQSVELRPDIEGRIAARSWCARARPSPAGSRSFKVDDAELKAEVARAEAERDLARQSLARTRELLAQKASSQSELERAEATGREHRGAVPAAQGAARADHGPRAVLRRRRAAAGEPRRLRHHVRRLDDAPDRVAPARGRSRCRSAMPNGSRSGQEVTFRVAALPGREFTGRVDFVDPVVQLPGRTITVKAQVPNPRRELQAGMFIEARLATAVRPNAVVIAEDAVLPIQGTNYVWVVSDGKATRRQVDLGVRTPGFVEARTGVEAGEQVVVGGQERLAEGAPVAATLVDRGPARPASGRESVGWYDGERQRHRRRGRPGGRSEAEGSLAWARSAGGAARRRSRYCSSAGAALRRADHARRAHELPGDLHLRRRGRLPRLAPRPGRRISSIPSAVSTEGRAVPVRGRLAPPGARPGRGGPERQADGLPPGEHPRRRSGGEGGRADAAARPHPRAARAAARQPRAPRRADLQRGRQRRPRAPATATGRARTVPRSSGGAPTARAWT